MTFSNDHEKAAMKPLRPIRRAAGLLAGLAAALLACAAAPAALAATAGIGPVGGSPAGGSPAFPGPNRSGYPTAPAQIHTIITMGGMPGWQITLIAAGAAILAAAAAVLLDRSRTARRHLTAPSA
jgi:hypothetical protein